MDSSAFIIPVTGASGLAVGGKVSTKPHLFSAIFHPPQLRTWPVPAKDFAQITSRASFSVALKYDS
jgi:hypothetical protein